MNLALPKAVLMYFSKGIDPRHPAQSAKADMGRNFSLSLHFMRVKG